MFARPATLWCLAVCLAVFVSGCAVRPAGSLQPDPDFMAPPMTLSDFYGFCSTADTPDGCFADPICLTYRRELAVAPADLAGCLAICRRVENDLYVNDLTNNCAYFLGRAEDLCDQFCRRRNAAMQQRP